MADFVRIVLVVHVSAQRTKVYSKNPHYPKVTAKGRFFVEHSDGYQLIHRKTNKYLSHYTKEDIKELEKKYGRRRPRKRRGSSSLP